MSNISPEELYQNYKDEKMDKSSIIEHLTSYIESSEKETLRIESIKILNRLKPTSSKIFNFLENLLISDTNQEINRIAAKIIIENYADKAFNPLKWIIHQPRSLKIILEIGDYIRNINIAQGRALLINLIQDLLKNENKLVPETMINYFSTRNNIDNFNALNIEELINIMFELKYPAYINDLCREHSCEENSWYVISDGHIKELQFEAYQGNDLPELAFLNRLKFLEKLTFHQCGIKDMSALGLYELKYLKVLKFFNEAISEIKGLRDCINLKKIIFFNTGISEISGLRGLVNLEELRIERNYITEIKGLDGLWSLKILSLKSNRISEFKGCEDLESLEILDLENNQIREINGLEYFQDLKEINLKANPIKNFNAYVKGDVKIIF